MDDNATVAGRARPRLPGLAVAAWAIAVAGLVGLGVAVAAYLSSGPGAGMAGHRGVGMALYRAGAAPSGPLLGSTLFTAWHLDAVAIAMLLVLAAGYLTAVALVPVRSSGRRWPLRRTTYFMAGLFVCAWATNGSVAVYDQTLFTAHMIGHLALVMLAPALLVAGQPLRLAIAATAPDASARIARATKGRVVSLLTAPPVALAAYAAVIVGSHLTGIMDSVMRHTWAGQVEHLAYLLVGIQFFVLVVGEEPIRWRLAAPAKWLLLGVGMAVDTFTGIVLLQGTRVVSMLPLHGAHVDRLSDTRTGGAIMWFGGDAIMAAIMIALVVTWLRDADTATQDEPSWLEQARRAAFTANVGGSSAAIAGELDDGGEDDAARAAYNEWLSRLDRQR